MSKRKSASRFHQIVTIEYRGDKAAFKIRDGNSFTDIQDTIRTRFQLDNNTRLILVDEDQVDVVIDHTLPTGNYTLTASPRGNVLEKKSNNSFYAFEKDPNSFSNNHQVLTNHLHLELQADFDKKILSGSIELKFKVVSSSVKNIILDTRDLKISKVSADGKHELAFNLGDEHKAFGRALNITLHKDFKKDDSVSIKIEYQTSPESSAIQWLPPAQTAGKKYPYLFTQCQAIHARAVAPVQDTPSVKSTYSANITVVKPLVALMSAKSTTSKASSDGKSVTYSFEQSVQTPSYLIALAIGALEKRDISDRVAIWSEKEMVDAGAHEFAETEKFLQTAESICGPYVWGRYDILLLPPSFPYGGMENPCLTFVTPTLLAGDRSMAAVIIHEISHSWMGNLVTSQTWEHFWLNEGWAVFVERAIVAALYGRQHLHLSAIIGWKALRESVEGYGADHPYTGMYVKLHDVDPDDAFSSVPYEKGFSFLYSLETLVGIKLFSEFVKAYVKQFQYSTVTSGSFKEFFLTYFSNIKELDQTKLKSINWDDAFNKPGLPPKPDFDYSLVNDANQFAEDLAKKEGKLDKKVSLEKWSANQVLVALERLSDIQAEEYKKAGTDVSKVQARWTKILNNIDSVHHFTDSKNSEIRFRWLSCCVRSELEDRFSAVVTFLKEQGRMKFVRPLYRALYASKKGKDLAVSTFKQNKSIYHSICSKMLAKDLEV